MLCYVMLCYVMSCHVLLCEAGQQQYKLCCSGGMSFASRSVSASCQAAHALLYGCFQVPMSLPIRVWNIDCPGCRGLTSALFQHTREQSDDAKGERIRQLQCTLSDLIDERDELQYQVDSLSQSELAVELEYAQSEIRWLQTRTESAVSERQSMRTCSVLEGQEE